jgi:hypothetical protein
VTDDSTLGGYFSLHARPPAFEGPDGAAYSVAVYVDETPGPDGRYGAALLFVRWSPAGEEPAGHVESEYLAYGRDPAEAEAAVRDLTLHQVKEQLDHAVARARGIPDWS